MGDEDHFSSTTHGTHGIDALLYKEQPILARSWIYQPSGYFRNGILPKFDDPDADDVTLSTATATYTAPAEPKATMTTWMDNASGLQTKNVLACKDSGFTKSLRPTRVTFRPGDKLGTRRARPASKAGGKKPLWKSTTGTSFKHVEEQSGPLPSIIASRPPGNSKTFPSRPEGKPGPETTGSVRNWSHNRGHVACASIFAKPISRKTITETTEQFIDPPLKVAGGKMKTGATETMNLSSTWVMDSPRGNVSAGSPTWKNAANFNSNEILSGHG